MRRQGGGHTELNSPGTENLIPYLRAALDAVAKVPEQGLRLAQRDARDGRGGKAAVAEETAFVMGAKVSCVDGPGGHVSRLIIDPATQTVTHLVIEPKHRIGTGRLVPLDLVDSTAGGIRLRCTVEEFGTLEPAEEMELVDNVIGDLYGPAGIQLRCRPLPRTLFRWVRQTSSTMSPSMPSTVRSGGCMVARSIRATTG